MKPTFKALGRRIVVRPDKQEQKTKGGIILPESYVNRFSTGVVVDIGAIESPIAIGDRIMYAMEAGLDIEVNGEKLVVLIEDNAMLNMGKEETDAADGADSDTAPTGTTKETKPRP